MLAPLFKLFFGRAITIVRDVLIVLALALFATEVTSS